MTKIKHNFYQAKTKRTVSRLSLLLALSMSSQVSWGQQVIGSFPTMDGGFEGQTVGALNTTAPTGTAPTTTFRTDAINNGTGIQSSVARTGGKSVNIYYSGATTKRILFTPTAGAGLITSATYTVQYYYRTAGSTGTGACMQVGVSTNTTGNVKYNINSVPFATLSATNGGWTRYASQVVNTVAGSASDYGWGTIRAATASSPMGVAIDVDDIVMYAGGEDTTAPDPATVPVVAIASATTLNVGWTAPGTGVDGGGYMVFRYATSPNADNDPNLGGIYALGNTTTNGTGALTGTVVYVGTGTSFVDTVADSSVSYYYKIYTVDKAFNYSSEITGTNAPAAATWNGTTWLNGTPSSTVEAIIDGVYSGAGFDAKKLTVNSGKSLTITSGNLTVQNEVINNGTVVIENNANLVQANNAVNTGAVTVKRSSSLLKRLDYTLWSSPVAGQKLAAFSPLTSLSPNRFYTYNTASNLYAETADPTVTNFTAGTGYLIRMPNTADPVTPTAYPGEFTGVPNNGDVPVTMTDNGAGFRFNLVGNPYPSPISMSSFVADNTNITGTLYFWRKTNGTGTAYCTWTAGTFTSNGNAQSVNPAGIIQTGQGFIVEANGSGTALTFKNTQRSNNTTGQFFRTKQTATADKVWLNATNTAGDFSQTAVTYSADGTTGADALDGKYINDSSFALTSNINNEEYTIQGRPSFDASDVVPLNFKTAAAGNYTIAIDHTEGVFAAGQDVILVDSTTGTETSLKSGSYTFTASAGASNSRFSLKYQKTLGVKDSVANDNSVAVYRSKGIVTVNSGATAIARVKVYDIQGKLLAELKDVNAASASISNLKASNQVLIVKVTLEDGTAVTKKVVN